MKITLIRHSKTAIEPNKSILLWGLADEGIEKAERLSADPVVQDLDAIYSSLQTKAIETMLYLAKPNAIPMRTHADLTEITSFTNKFLTGDEYTTGIKKFYAREIDRIADGETIDEALARFEAALDEIVTRESQSKNIGIVTHGYILSFFSGKYSEADPYELHHDIAQPDVAVFDFDTKKFLSFWGK